MPACGEHMPIGMQLPEAETKCVADWIVGMASGGGCETCGGSECVALAADPLHCGRCDNPCPEGVACENGQCACFDGATACDGACVDTMTDEAHCGGCKIACSPGSSCEGGQCVCPEALASCGGECADLQSNAAHCGDCDVACAALEVCLLGQCAEGCGGLEQCGTSCVDVRSSLLHCGACDQACPGGTGCENGACICPGGGRLCDGSCVDTESDPQNCGGCGQRCGAGESCVAGSCGCTVTAPVSFRSDVEPILDRGCTAAGCHTGMRPKEDLALDTGKAYAELVGVATKQCGGQRQLVVPGNPSTSYLMQKLLNVDICMGSQMPKAGQSLPAADLEVISNWICAGAPND
jgi:hypothetical protein